MVIPVWDAYAGEHLSAAVESLTSQTPPARILLVDNASEREIAADGDIRVVRTDSRVTVGAARRFGLEHSETPLTLFWDADDVMLPGTLAKLVAAIREHPGVVAVTPAIMDGSTGARLHWPRSWTRHLSRFPRCFAAVNAVSSLYPTTGALVDTHTALEAGGHPDAHGGDDWAFGVSLAFRGRVVLLRDLGRVYRYRPGSLSAGWRAVPDLSRHAALVRQRLREDPAVPPLVRRSVGLIALLQWAVIFVARPVSRALPHRTRARRRQG